MARNPRTGNHKLENTINAVYVARAECEVTGRPLFEKIEDFFESNASGVKERGGGGGGGGGGILVEFNGIESCMKMAAIPADLRELCDSYGDIFQSQIQLPPQREHNHSIILKEGTDHISVRPYRYYHSQKNKIERLVQDMLKAGIIKPSISPSSNPIILVKKNRSWRFYADYRALNKATVPDKYPIPMIDKLLDELHRATLFMKPDLKSGYHQIRMKTYTRCIQDGLQDPRRPL